MKRSQFLLGIPLLLIVAAFLYLRIPDPAGSASSTGSATRTPAVPGPSTLPHRPVDTIQLKDEPETPLVTQASAQPRPSRSDVVAMVGDFSVLRGDLADLPDRRDDQTRLDELIARALLRLELRNRGATLPASLVDDRVTNIVATRFNGDQAAFESAIAAQGYTRDEFRQLQKETIETETARQLILREAGVTSRPKVEQEETLRQWVAQRREDTPVTFPSTRK